MKNILLEFEVHILLGLLPLKYVYKYVDLETD